MEADFISPFLYSFRKCGSGECCGYQEIVTNAGMDITIKIVKIGTP